MAIGTTMAVVIGVVTGSAIAEKHGVRTEPRGPLAWSARLFNFPPLVFSPKVSVVRALAPHSPHEVTACAWHDGCSVTNPMRLTMRPRRSIGLATSTIALVLCAAGCAAHREPSVATARPAGLQTDLTQASLRRTLTTIKSRESERGIVLTIPGVLFDADAADMNVSAQHDLAAIASYLKEHPAQHVVIEGHTDSIGTEAHNHDLSLRRSTVVETFFLQNGVDPERLDVRGLGEDHPVASNATALGRQENRRVDIVMLAGGATASAEKPAAARGR